MISKKETIIKNFWIFLATSLETSLLVGNCFDFVRNSKILKV